MSDRAPGEYLHAVECGGGQVLFDSNRVRTYACSPLESRLLGSQNGATGTSVTVEAGATGLAVARERLRRLAGLSDALSSTRGFTSEHAGHPTYLFMNVCYACNLDCDYCYASDCTLGQSHLFMSNETARASVEFLLRGARPERSFRISFAGGEPLLNLPAIRAAVREARARAEPAGLSVTYRVLTNGTVMSREILEFLTRHNVSLQISLDGPPEMHDRLRPTRKGDGSAERILETVEFLEGEGFSDYAVRGTVCHSNADPDRLTAFFRDRGFPSFSLRPLMGEEGDPHRLRPADVQRVASHYRKVGCQVAEQMVNGSDEEIPSDFSMFVGRIELGVKTKRYCGAGRELLVVDPQGDFYPCPAVAGEPRFRSGNVETGFHSAGSETLPNPGVDDKAGCGRCWARNLCGGGCSFQALRLNGDVGRPDRVECALIQARAEASIEIVNARQERIASRRL